MHWMPCTSPASWQNLVIGTLSHVRSILCEKNKAPDDNRESYIIEAWLGGVGGTCIDFLLIFHFEMSASLAQRNYLEWQYLSITLLFSKMKKKKSFVETDLENYWLLSDIFNIFFFRHSVSQHHHMQLLTLE